MSTGGMHFSPFPQVSLGFPPLISQRFSTHSASSDSFSISLTIILFCGDRVTVEDGNHLAGELPGHSIRDKPQSEERHEEQDHRVYVAG